MPDQGRSSRGASSAERGVEPIKVPSISLPKGGGAIRGMGEKFTANPATGTGSMSVPIATSPGRSGFGPQLSLSYDSGAGNGPFGLGWSLSLPAITWKTDKGLPKYQADDGSPVFILSGSEDLVPILVDKGGGKWECETVVPRIVGGQTYDIRRYRPRIEGLFARIERWTNQADAGDTFWRSISRDNITTWYGRTAESRIADPANATHVFSWLICESYDDKGNVIVYRYQEENSANVDLSQAHERNRNPVTRSANRFLKCIRYGYHAPYLPRLLADAPWPTPPESDSWFFEVVFDYGEHDPENPLVAELGNSWPVRKDPFSSYRPGFEVRTYRLCQRVLMFHHFPGEPGVGANCLTRATEFTYAYEERPDRDQDPIFSLLRSVAHTGHQREGASYLSRSLPPLEFTYSAVLTPRELDAQPIKEVDPDSVANLPSGIDGSLYQWTDLDGEGSSGILTDQGESWLYKRNFSPLTGTTDLTRTAASLGPVEQLAEAPSFGARHQQFLDLAADGQLDAVDLSGPTPGFYERTRDAGWTAFTPFTSLPVVEWDNPNLRFVDLTGDGHADILITEDEVFCWHPSLAEAGFGAPQRVRKVLDDEKGPNLVFADGTQSIYLADMSGDGLTDLVRIRNGDVSYWPNLGYGRFGAKVTMDGAPWFDAPDRFDQKRIRLADTDGSGLSDILYLRPDGVDLYFNRSGNSWSAARTLHQIPSIDNVSAVNALDLLGSGTACLVWSSALPGNARRPMRYLDLMGGKKPHLLEKVANNLGAETTVQYAPSTRFYLADRAAGEPWITRLPFPVHCVANVTVRDRWRQTAFSSTYSYHHGYFDGPEREFRGFGRVEQVDVESYGSFGDANAASPYITADKTMYQPPVKTVSWFHTGAFVDRERILSQFEREYFPRWFEDLKPGEDNVLGAFEENVLPQPDLPAQDLSADEWREALRACKGMLLRQEVYQLDVDALERHEQRPVKLFTTAYHNCHIQRLQARAGNRHAVFLVAESESIAYHYELDLTREVLRPDPRISHTLNLRFDDYANVLQSLAVAYPRMGQFEDSALSPDTIALIRSVQGERHLAYSETRYTSDFVDEDNHRLRLPCEALTYELTGIAPADARFYFTLDELRALHLSLVHQVAGQALEDIPYHQLPKNTQPEKRLVEHVRTLFFKDDPAVPGALEEPLPLGQLGRLGLTYETYGLALTTALLDAVFSDAAGNKLDQPVRAALTAREMLKDATLSGYLSGTDLAKRFTPAPPAQLAGQYWIRSGTAGFAPDAAARFYLPEQFKDVFGNITTLTYDQRVLFVKSTTDAIGNVTQVAHFDYRVLAPREMRDLNDNLSEVAFDVMGFPIAVALKGKGDEADNFVGFTSAMANPDRSALTAFFASTPYLASQARQWLGNATARHVYYFGDTEEALPGGGTRIHWAAHPACACGIVRERHVSQLGPGEESPLQVGFEYSDGLGAVIVKKVQAEPKAAGAPLRWVASGKTVLNNKGRPVKQYESYFSENDLGQPDHRYEEPSAKGVTPLIYYDAVGRTVRTELPDGAYSRVEFSPWHIKIFDPNDTIKEPGNAWFARKTAATATAENRRAARLAAEHADTPALTVLDSLGREVVSIAHNRVRNATGGLDDERYVTRTKLDAEGRPLWVWDARNNLVMQYFTPVVPNNQSTDPIAGFIPCYDIAGNLLFQHSMDAGDRWMLNDATGKPMVDWDSRGHVFSSTYDELRRSVASFVKGADAANLDRVIQFERIVYGEADGGGLANPKQLNLRGKPFKHHDTAGVVVSLGANPATGVSEGFDFNGNLLRSTRQLLVDYRNPPDWSGAPPLEAEVFSSSTRYDALNRAIQGVAPHSNAPGTKVNVIRHGYNEAGLLERMDVWLEQAGEPGALLDVTTATQHIVTDIDYDAKGQRELIAYGNGVTTSCEYDPLTFRLARLRTLRGADTLQDLSYTYDLVGNITQIRDEAQDFVFHSNACVSPGAEYRYDALYRLVAAGGREHKGGDAQPGWDDSARIVHEIPNDCQALRNYVETYRYDAVGNILQMRHHQGRDLDQPGVTIWNRRYQYAQDSNRLLASSLPGDPDGLPDYTGPPATPPIHYDAHGSMTSMSHLPSMRWDFRERLCASQRQAGGAGVTLLHLQRGRRAGAQGHRNRSRGPTDERIYLGGFEVYRRSDANPLVRETLHVMDDQRRIGLVETRTQGIVPGVPPLLIRYQLSNHLGSAWWSWMTRRRSSPTRNTAPTEAPPIRRRADRLRSRSAIAHGEGAGRRDGAVLPRGSVLRLLVGAVDGR